MPGGTVSEVSRTSPAFSPKIARSSFSSGVSWVSPLGDVRDVAGDLLLAELRVARLDLEFLDVDRREPLALDEALGHEDRVLEVVAAPRHERDEHVPPQRELALVGPRAVGDHVARRHALALTDDRLLVDAGVLVRPPVLRQVVDVEREVLHRIGLLRPALGAHHHAVGRHVLDHTEPLGHDDRARVARDHVLHPGAHQRRLGLQERHRLALHVRAHERAVRVVVLEERDQRRGHRDELLRRHVHVVQLLGRDHAKLAALARRDPFLDEAAVPVDLGVGLGDDELLLLERRQEHDLVRDAPMQDLPVRRLDEAELVRSRVGRERRDQADVRAFGRLDRADPAVVRRMDVAHLEPGAFAGEASRTQRREAALVGQLCQRVRLVHELRELRRAEKLLHDRRDRLRVDEVVRHEVRDVRDGHPLLHRALHPRQAHAELVLEQLADGPDAAIAEVVDVVGRPGPELDHEKVADHRHDVLAAQRLDGERRVDL